MRRPAQSPNQPAAASPAQHLPAASAPPRRVRRRRGLLLLVFSLAIGLCLGAAGAGTPPFVIADNGGNPDSPPPELSLPAPTFDIVGPGSIITFTTRIANAREDKHAYVNLVVIMRVPLSTRFVEVRQPRNAVCDRLFLDPKEPDLILCRLRELPYGQTAEFDLSVEALAPTSARTLTVLSVANVTCGNCTSAASTATSVAITAEGLAPAPEPTAPRQMPRR